MGVCLLWGDSAWSWGPTELWPFSSAVPLPAQCMGPAAVHAWVPSLVSLWHNLETLSSSVKPSGPVFLASAKQDGTAGTNLSRQSSCLSIPHKIMGSWSICAALLAWLFAWRPQSEHDSHINSIWDKALQICCLLHIIYIHILYLADGSKAFVFLFFFFSPS